MNNKTFISVLIVLAVVAIFSIISYLPAKFDDSTLVRMSDFPQKIGEWTSYKDIEFDKRVYDLLETDNFIMRDYTNKKGDTINLYIIYSEKNRKVAHPPEICLQGDGAIVVDKSLSRISPAIRAVKLILEKKDFQEIAVYWYKTGKVFTHNYLLQQIADPIDRMLGKKTSVALIRVIAQIKNKDHGAAFNQITSFSRAIEPLLYKYAP
jgi:EpsI family protein